MNRPDRPVLQLRRRNHSALPVRVARSRRNAHQKENGIPTSAAEFRRLGFSFCRHRNAKPSLRVSAGKLREMPIKQSSIDSRSNAWIVWLWFDLFDDAA